MDGWALGLLYIPRRALTEKAHDAFWAAIERRASAQTRSLNRSRVRQVGVLTCKRSRGAASLAYVPLRLICYASITVQYMFLDNPPCDDQPTIHEPKDTK